MLNFPPIIFPYNSNFLLEEKLMFMITLPNAKVPQESKQITPWLPDKYTILKSLAAKKVNG